ncbi:MAG: iron ABC transporter permease, partial [Syntrophomonadaceae bacterium]|nr:iron ABC transporter permease [Syntrophomonadaceae bacterium]
METVVQRRISEIVTKRDAGWKIIILLLTLILIFILSFALGRYPVPPGQLLEVLAARVLPLEPTWNAT